MAQLVPRNLAQLVTFKKPKLGPVKNFTAYIYIYVLKPKWFRIGG